MLNVTNEKSGIIIKLLGIQNGAPLLGSRWCGWFEVQVPNLKELSWLYTHSNGQIELQENLCRDNVYSSDRWGWSAGCMFVWPVCWGCEVHNLKLLKLTLSLTACNHKSNDWMCCCLASVPSNLGLLPLTPSIQRSLEIHDLCPSQTQRILLSMPFPGRAGGNQSRLWAWIPLALMLNGSENLASCNSVAPLQVRSSTRFTSAESTYVDMKKTTENFNSGGIFGSCWLHRNGFRMFRGPAWVDRWMHAKRADSSALEIWALVPGLDHSHEFHTEKC